MSKKNRSPWRKIKPVQPSTAHAEPQGPARGGFPTAAISELQLAANRANAQLSTGPRTEAGLARSSQNAIKSALTGRTVLLPTDDLEEYAAFLAEYETDLKPFGQQEKELVQIIVDCHWRLRRIQELEYAIYLRGERQFADTIAEECPIIRRSMIVLETHLAYQKELRNLQIQEARIDRKRTKALAELKELQKERKQPAEDSAENNYGFASEEELFDALDAGFIPPSIAENYARFAGKAAEAAENGFVFSDAA
jgi:hypothetical protein